MTVAMAPARSSGLEVSSGEMRKVIFASSLGTMFEWYDFYLYGSLAALIGKYFFTGLADTAQYVFALLAFAAGFFVRPFGAILFGRLGDVLGRKITFLTTMIIMGLSTFAVGFLPSYAAIGIYAPVILIGLRLLQGLAIGGEYGGAATYVAEHSEDNHRGYRTSWIQTTATLGLFLPLIVLLVCQYITPGDAAAKSAAYAAEWGTWRWPFYFSGVLLIISVWIRATLNESPAFQKIKDEGTISSAPLSEAFGNPKAFGLMLLTLFGLTMGQAVVWYGSQFYLSAFLVKAGQMNPYWVNMTMAIALLLGVPFFVVFGWLSDKIGRKPIIMAGLLFAAVGYFPLFEAIAQEANPPLYAAAAASPVTVTADPNDCHLQFDPVGKSTFTSPCDVAKTALNAKGVPYLNAVGTAGAAQIKIGDKTIDGYDAKAADAKDKKPAFDKALADALTGAGYPAKSPIEYIDWKLVGLCWLAVLLATMVYGPIAAMLVEMFPTRYRYSAMSLPYHLGNGWFGGFLPAITVAIVAATGSNYAGLWYPVIVAGVCFVIGLLFVRETLGTHIDAHERDAA